jgi:Peptidase A4 family
MTLARSACLAALAVAALVLTGVAGAHPVPARHRTGPLTAPAVAWPGSPIVRVSLPRGVVTATAAAAAAAAEPAISSITSLGSLNWAGYAVSRSGVRFNSIQATFFVPYLTCSKALGQTLSSDWVGLDGFVGKPDSVEQGGVGADCSAAGKASYYAWWETFPKAETKAALSVKPGDSITATVSYSTARKDFRITLTDNTRGGRFSVTRGCPAVKVGKKAVTCPRNSAEVISEAPATGTSAGKVVIARLSDYDAVSFGAIAIADASGQRGSLVSGHWNTTKIIQLRSSGAIAALPTSTQAATFVNYWLRENN